VPELQRLAAESDRLGAFPDAEFSLLREVGLLCAPAPTPGGGLGSQPGTRHALFDLLRTVGRGSLPVGRIYEGHVNALLLIDQYGTDAQRRRAARDAADGHLFGVWNTEGRDGVTLTPLPGGGLRFSGAKTFCSGATAGTGGVTRPFVNGALPDGSWQMAVIPLDEVEAEVDPAWWQAEGMRASSSGRVDVSGVEVGPEWVVGAPGDYLAEPAFSGGAVRFAAVHLGGADALGAATADHLRRLDRLGSDAQRLRLGEMAIALETGALWLLGAARLQEEAAVPVADQVAYAQFARCAVERVCLDVLERADRAVGARGVGVPGVVERVGRDLRLYLRQPNPDGALMAGGLHAATADAPCRGSDVHLAAR
jgi:alkylation response protein AidB-like acyl-CoA dehydrogenase